jgi:hypothetical protein
MKKMAGRQTGRSRIIRKEGSERKEKGRGRKEEMPDA